MGSQWLLLLLLLFIGDGALILPGIITTWGVESDTTASTKVSVPKGTMVYSSTASALSNNGRDNVPAAPLHTSLTTRRTAASESQKHTTPATPPTSPRASSSAASTEQTTSVHETQEERLNTTITTIPESKALSNSMMTSTLKDQGGTSRSTASPSTATSAETPNHNQRAPTAAPLASSSIVIGLESSACTDSQMSATLTAPTALNTPGNDITSSGPTTTTVSEEAATTISPTTLNKITDIKESLPMTTSAVIHTTPLTVTTLGTTVLGTTMSGTQEGETTAAPSTPTTAPTMSALSDTHHNTAAQAPSHPAESASTAGTATAQSPETTAAHSTALILSSSGTTKSSAMTGASEAFPKHSQSSGPGEGICALDEYPTGKGICMCNDSYYAHSEPSRVLVALHCQPQKIEVVLSSCFLKTRHWILREGAFSGCSSVSKIEEDHHVRVFTLEKRRALVDPASLHALYSLEVQLLQVLSGFTDTDSTMLSFSCTYPLVVNVSQTHPYPVVSFPYITIHVPGTGDTIVILGIFTDPQLSSPLENRPDPLGKPLYMVLRATSSDPNRFALVANEVFASTNISRTGPVKDTYHFVKESCPVSNQLLGGLRDNGACREVTLAFNLSRFLTSDTLYVHGRVTLCDTRAGRPCQPTCSQKSLRGRNRDWEIRARESLDSGAGWMVFGPIRISESNASSSRSSAGAWIPIFLLMVISWMLG